MIGRKEYNAFAVVNKRNVVITVPAQIGDDQIYVEAIFRLKRHARVWQSGNLKIIKVVVQQ